MGISDALFEAQAEIESTLDEFGERYAFVRPRIEALLAEMAEVTRLIDSPIPPQNSDDGNKELH